MTIGERIGWAGYVAAEPDKTKEAARKEEQNDRLNSNWRATARNRQAMPGTITQKKGAGAGTVRASRTARQRDRQTAN